MYIKWSKLNIIQIYVPKGIHIAWHGSNLKLFSLFFTSVIITTVKLLIFIFIRLTIEYVLGLKNFKHYLFLVDILIKHFYI